MGITIHYAGQLWSDDSLNELIDRAEVLASKLGWYFERTRVQPDSPPRGFVVFPHHDCEPLRIEADARLKFSGWVKTQFAGVEIHIQVVRFLRELRSFFRRFGTRDEGEYWHTGDEAMLRWHINKINELIQEAVERNPDIRTKIRMPDGLMIDYIE